MSTPYQLPNTKMTVDDLYNTLTALREQVVNDYPDGYKFVLRDGYGSLVCKYFVCPDDVDISIQASSTHYCLPDDKTVVDARYYTHFEVLISRDSCKSDYFKQLISDHSSNESSVVLARAPIDKIVEEINLHLE